MDTTRQLAAIMFTDIHGYTALMQQSEAKAIAVRERHRQVFDAATENFKGEVIQYFGDGTLSTFSSAVMAVKCAVEMQQQYAGEPPLPVRIGIHLGDIVRTEDDIIGDSVNLASRVESLAVPGSVLISDKVYREIENQEEIEVKSLGEFHFKNDRGKRTIYAVIAPGLVVPDKVELKGKTEDGDDGSQKKRISRPMFLGALAIVIAGVFGFNYLQSQSRIKWVQTEAISEIESLIEVEDYKGAFEQVQEALKIIPDDAKLAELVDQCSRAVNLFTNPDDVQVFRKPYGEENAEWEFVGTTPFEEKRLHLGNSLWRFEKQDFDEQVRMGRGNLEWMSEDTIGLLPAGTTPEGMVYVPGEETRIRLPGIVTTERLHVPDFFMDKHEVTNMEYKEFVDAGGYQNEEFWKYPFQSDGQNLTWADAMTRFTDKTGRPGPAGWSVSDFPEGQENYPVQGVSWYEAAAYAEYVNKALPTVFHFNRAATTSLSDIIVPASNFNDEGAVEGGIFQGVGGFGTYDLAGNVREWYFTRNRDDQQRFIMGGGWSDPYYAAQDGYAQGPFDRSDINGFRCIRYFEDAARRIELEKPLGNTLRDPSKQTPVGDAVFALYARQFVYDQVPFQETSEPIPLDHEDYTCEKVTIDAAYGGERMAVYLYRPRDIQPPYQTVLIFPGAGAIHSTEYSQGSITRLDFLLKSGRALVFPVYKGTFYRRDGLPNGFPAENVFYKEHVIMWTKDVSRTIDYLETLDDFDADRVAFYGLSWGGITGGIIPAIEKRITTIVLTVGGLALQRSLPEVDQLHYLPRIGQPTLMMNGRYDFFFPYETSQRIMFDLLGTPNEHKRHVVADGTHNFPGDQLIKESLDWLDKYLGPVN